MAARASDVALDLSGGRHVHELAITELREPVHLALRQRLAGQRLTVVHVAARLVADDNAQGHARLRPADWHGLVAQAPA